MTHNSLRFAIVTTFYPPYSFGGDAQYVQQLVHALAARGHEVTVIHDQDAYRMLSKGAEPAPEPARPGVRIVGLRSRLGRLSCLLTQQTGRPIVHGSTIRRLLDEDVDVIHFHNVSLVGGPGILRYGSAIKLYTAHEHWLVCPSHILWRHNREPCPGRQCLRCVLHHRRPPQLWRAGSLLRRSTEHIDAFISFSRFSIEKHKEFGFFREMITMPSFMPDASSIYANDATSIASAHRRPYFLFVGRLEIVKGLQDVIPLFRANKPYDLLIAGDGVYEAKLRQLAAGIDSVKFLGRLPAEKLSTLYQNAIAMLAPSMCFEVFPMVVLEAFREGTPVIARKRGPFPEIIAQSGGGLLFESPHELEIAMNRLANDHALRNSLSCHAQHAFGRYWSETVAMDEYFAIIRRIAAEKGMQEVVAKIAAPVVGTL